MSVLPTQSWITANNPLFLLANISSLTSSEVKANSVLTNTLSTGQATISSIKGTEGGVNIDFAFISSLNSDGKIEATEFSSIFTYAQEGTVSTLFTQHIVLDQATLDVINGNTLLLNGVPLATTSTSISSLQDWSFYPALQVVDMNGFNLSNTGNINSQNIFNALNIQSDTFTGLTSLTSPAGTITNLRTTGLSTNSLQVNTINNGGNTNWVSPLSVSSLAVSSLTTPFLSVPVVAASGLSSLTVSTGTLNAGTINGQPFISGSNWSQYPATTDVQMGTWTLNSSNNLNFNAASNTNFTTAGDYTLTADGGLSIASITDVAITAQNGNRGQISLTAGPGYNNGVAGVINLTADGGSVLGVGTGGTINITANTPLGLSNLTSKISLSASGINSYAGSIPALASVYGYNFIYGQLGVNICGGLPPFLPNTAGTTYIYGTFGVEIPSDAYMANIYPYWNGLTTPPDLTINGRYIIPNLAQVCVRMSNVRQIDFQSNVATYMSNLDVLSMTSNGSINTSNLITSGAQITTLSNINIVGVAALGSQITGYSNITTSNLTTTTINGAAYPPLSPPISTVSTFATADVGILTVSSIQKATFLDINTPTIGFSYPGGTNFNNVANMFGATGSNLQINSATVSINAQPGGYVKVGTTTSGDIDTHFLPNATVSTQNLFVSTINGQPYSTGGGGATISSFTNLYTSSFEFSTATSVGSNTDFNYPIFIDYDSAGNTSTAGVCIAVQAHNYAGGAVINRIEMGARATGENYIMSVWPGQNLEDLNIDSTQVIFNDGNFSTIVNGDPYGLQTNGIVQAGNISTVALQCSTINGVSTDPVFGEFLTTSTITVSGANTPTLIPLDTNTVGNGVSLSAGNVVVAEAGLYEYSFNVQLDKSGGGIDICDLWLQVNTVDVPGTGSRISIQGATGQCLAVCSFLLSLNATDRISLVFASADSSMAATFFPAWTTGGGDPYDRPSVPANIVQVRKIR
jgi:hypothetical protein